MPKPVSSASLTERPVSLAMAAFQSIGDRAMQCGHGLSVFNACRNC